MILIRCKRVKHFGKNRISQQQCKARLPKVNTQCIKIARKHTPKLMTDQQGFTLVKILMGYPMAKILNYPFIIKQGRPMIIFPD